MKPKVILYTIVLCFFTAALWAQGPAHSSLRETMAAIDSLHKRLPPEQLYLQLDKPGYALGDTIRFKAYLLNEGLSASLRSGLLYVELVNDSSRIIKRQMIKMHSGIAVGDIVLKNTWYQGNYTMRAYTSWMRNFGPEQFFTRQISILSADRANWLVNNNISFDKDKNVNLALQFSDAKHNTIGFKDMQLSLMQGTSVLLKNTVRTDPKGNTDIKFGYPENLPDKPLYIIAEDISPEGKVKKITIPFQLNRPENIDLQFMPEGGNLLAGISAKIGFKAIGEDGKGVEISGRVYDSKQHEVSTLKSTHKGMGAFELSPLAGENYSAKIISPDGSSKSYPLPVINPSGIALKINSQSKDSLEITLSATANLVNASAVYYLIGQARDKVCYGSDIVFKQQQIHKKIARAAFPTGIAKFVLFDALNGPVTQRMVFIDHDDRLKINLITNKEIYTTRDNIGLLFSATDATGNPVRGNFSLAVTDDSQVKPFNGSADNIASYMLLHSDLKGNIEEPGYYFNNKHNDRAIALDNLMLTQGWADYSWAPAFALPVQPEYEAEEQFIVKGRVSNVLNIGVGNTEITLQARRQPAVSLSTQTDSKGRFVFKDFPQLDTIDFYLETKREFNIGVVVDEFVPPEFTPAKYKPAPWYINTDTALVNYISEKQTEQEEALDMGKSKLLNQVNITAGRYVNPLSKFLFALNEEQIRTARPGKKPLMLMQLLNQKQEISQMYKNLIIDGRAYKPLDRAGRPTSFTTLDGLIDINHWLNNFTTEDIKWFKVTQTITIGAGGHDLVYLLIEIATNSGGGEDASIVGTYFYRPMPMSWPHRFYAPRYTVNTPVTGKDNRSTIYWAPIIEPDDTGKAQGSFYSADTPGTYTVIVEGTDFKGHVGYYRQQIKIGSKTMSSR